MSTETKYKEPAPYKRGEANPFESMMVRFDKAAELCKLDEGLYNYLKYHVKQVIVSIPVMMDSGKLEVFEGYRVIPVSYTHLDVYKRQLYYSSSIFIHDGRI